MRKRLLAPVALALLIGFPPPPNPAAEKAAEVGKPAPDLRLTALDGAEFHLSDLRGKKVVLLALWAVWCPPCVEEIPRLNEMHARYASRGLVILGLGVPQGQDEGAIRKFLDKTEVLYPVAFDREDQAGSRYGALFVPQNYLIAADGTVTYKGTVLPRDLEERVQGLLAAIPGGTGPAAGAPGPR